MTDHQRPEALRAQFEREFGKLPYEFGLSRFPETGAWAGHYTSLTTQCGWEGYQAGHAAAKAETAAAAAKEREWANRSAHDLFLAAFDTYLDEVGVAGALSAATTIFVSLVVSYTKACGHDADRPITINGGENRDVTIHAPKEGAASA